MVIVSGVLKKENVPFINFLKVWTDPFQFFLRIFPIKNNDPNLTKNSYCDKVFAGNIITVNLTKCVNLNNSGLSNFINNRKEFIIFVK